MKTETLSSMDDVSTFVKEYADKGNYFRGETRDYGPTACLPLGICKCSTKLPDSNYTWFADLLVSLGAGVPFIPLSSGDSSWTISMKAVTSERPGNLEELFGKDKTGALVKHYAPDFEKLEAYVKEDDNRYKKLREASEASLYLDITSDITVALRFACSEHCFYQCKRNKPSQPENIEDGVLFVLDLKNAKTLKHIKLVEHPCYSYFCRYDTAVYSQSFDRINRQQGSFITPRKDENGEIYRDEFKRDLIETCIVTKVIIPKEVKEQLYETFGGERGLEYFFPKIHIIKSPAGTEQYQYKRLQSITLKR